MTPGLNARTEKSEHGSSSSTIVFKSTSASSSTTKTRLPSIAVDTGTRASLTHAPPATATTQLGSCSGSLYYTKRLPDCSASPCPSTGRGPCEMSCCSAAMTSAPPFGVASRALTARFSSANPSYARSVWTRDIGKRVVMATCVPTVRSRISAIPRTVSTILTGCIASSCLRTKASMRWGRAAPRCAA